MTESATLELLAWIAAGRSYTETIEVWGSWCPRHAAWEDALAAGLVRVADGRVELTPEGRAALSLTSPKL